MTRRKSRSATQEKGGSACCTLPPVHSHRKFTYCRSRESGWSNRPTQLRARRLGLHLS
jgi:hypothetical protein